MAAAIAAAPGSRVLARAGVPPASPPAESDPCIRGGSRKLARKSVVFVFGCAVWFLDSSDTTITLASRLLGMYWMVGVSPSCIIRVCRIRLPSTGLVFFRLNQVLRGRPPTSQSRMWSLLFVSFGWLCISGDVDDGGEEDDRVVVPHIPDLDYASKKAPAPTFAVLPTPMTTWAAIEVQVKNAMRSRGLLCKTKWLTKQTVCISIDRFGARLRGGE